VLGIAIRVNQYLHRQALWLDEAMLSLSIVNRSWRELIVSPLEFGQTSSPLYLQLAHASTVVFGPNELALRLPSIVFSVSSMIVFAILARRIFTPSAAVVATAFFALSPMLVRYSGEAKPYSADVFVSVLLMLCAIRLRDSRFAMKWIITFAASVTISVFLSDVGILLVGGICAALAFLAWRERDAAAWRAAKILAPLVLLISLTVLWAINRRIGAAADDTFHGYWRDGFWPLFPPQSLSDVFWPLRVTSLMFTELGGIRSAAGLALVISIAGCIVFWHRGRRETNAIIAGLFLVALAATTLRLYPFIAARVCLYLLPGLIIAFTQGLEYLSTLGRRYTAPLLAIFFCLFLMPQSVVAASAPPPWLIQDIPGVLAYVQAHRDPADPMYVFWGAVPATFFYGPRFGIERNDIIQGKLHRKDLAAYGRDIDELFFRGRVWLIFSNDFHPEERDAILAKMDSLGHRVTEFPSQAKRTDAVTYLYEVSPGR
jgi:4-amino-4-deoxy-L-arabinose transferase-like glycosyltransferase